MPDPAPAVAAPPEITAAHSDLRRIPHLGDVLLLAVLFADGLLCTVILTLAWLRFHLFGIGTIPQAMHSLTFALGTMLALYLIAFLPGAALYPLLWRRPLLAGLHWNAAAVRRRWAWWMAAGVACFFISFAFGKLLHFPAHTPMEELLTTPAAYWTLWAFAITIAPLSEEIVFRGFLLPAFATAFDWLGQSMAGRRPAHPVDADGHPQWSVPAMILAAIPTSMLFALVHSSQNAHAWGPFILLCSVSLVLCAVRFAARSVAASTLTHATYNCTLFVVMFFHSRAFTHLH